MPNKTIRNRGRVSVGRLLPGNASARGSKTELKTLNKELSALNQQLRQGETRYRELVQNANSAILRWKSDGSVAFFNEYAQSFFGYSEKEILGKHVSILVPDVDSAGRDLHVMLRDIVAHPERYVQNVNENICRDGRRVWMAWTNKPVFDENGEVSEILSVGTDISERRRIEQALSESEEKFHSAFSNAAIGFAMMGPDGRFLDANPAYCTLTGYSIEELRATRFQRLIHPDDFAHNMTLVEQMLAGQIRDFTIESRYARKDGTTVWVSKNVSLVRDAEGEPKWIFALIHDITKRKRAEAALHRTAERLQLLSNSASRLLASDNPQLVVNDLCREVMRHLDCHVFFNFLADRRAGRLHLNACAGIEEAERRQIEWLDYGVAVCGCAAQDGRRIIAEDILHVPDPRTDLVRSFGIQAYCCHPLLVQDRVIGTLSFGARNRTHFTDEEVDVMRTVADQVAVAMQRLLTLQDLQELNESLEQRVAERTSEVQQQSMRLSALAAELGQAEQRERKRLATILHDHIQQLLVAAQMHLGLVKHADAATIGPAIQGVESILREAIDASRSLAVDMSPPILHQGGLGPALGWLASRMEEKNLFKVHVRADSEAEPKDESARMLLFESARELLLNAVKHSGAREARLMMLRTPDNWTKIVIEDQGVGFDQEAVNTNGSGLGLFGIQQRLNYMGGKMEVESAPGKGTRIILLAPPAESQIVASSPPAAMQGAGTGDVEFEVRKSRRIGILLVDDHKIVRQGLANMLQSEADLEVVAEAEDGIQALELARRHRPDVVVTDISMPGMDGVELTRVLHQEMPAIKIIGLSMHIEKNVAESMRQAGAAGYLTKGGLSEDLVAAIRACVSETWHAA